MTNRDRQIIVIARLKPKPLLAGQLLSALVFFAVAAGEAVPVSADGVEAMLRAALFGNAAAGAAMLFALFAFWICLRLWRHREAWIFHDGVRLYRGGILSWPLQAVRDVVVERSGFGFSSLRLVVDDDSETTRELVMLPLLDGSPEAVRGGVLFAAAGVGAVPDGVIVH